MHLFYSDMYVSCIFLKSRQCQIIGSCILWCTETIHRWWRGTPGPSCRRWRPRSRRGCAVRLISSGSTNTARSMLQTTRASWNGNWEIIQPTRRPNISHVRSRHLNIDIHCREITFRDLCLQASYVTQSCLISWFADIFSVHFCRAVRELKTPGTL